MESDGKTFIELVITNYESEPPQMEMFIWQINHSLRVLMPKNLC
jgi:hypothetical protein